MNMQRLLVASAVFITALTMVGCGQKKETQKAKAPAEASHNVKSYDKPVNPSEPVGQNTSPNVVPNAASTTSVAQEPEGLSYIPPIEETATSATITAPSATVPANSTDQPSAPSSVKSASVNLNAQPSVSASVNSVPVSTNALPSVPTSVNTAPVSSNAQPSVPTSVNTAPVSSNAQPSVPASVNTAPVSSSAQPGVPAFGNITPVNPQGSTGVGSASAVVKPHQGQTSASSTGSPSSPVLTGAAATPAAVTPSKSSQ